MFRYNGKDYSFLADAITEAKIGLKYPCTRVIEDVDFNDVVGIIRVKANQVTGIVTYVKKPFPKRPTYGQLSDALDRLLAIQRQVGVDSVSFKSSNTITAKCNIEANQAAWAAMDILLQRATGKEGAENWRS